MPEVGKTYPGAQLLVVGQGVDRQRLKKRAQVSTQIGFLGFEPDEALGVANQLSGNTVP